MTSTAQAAPLQSFLSTLLRERRHSCVSSNDAVVCSDGSMDEETDTTTSSDSISIVVDNARTRRRSETSYTMSGSWVYADGEISYESSSDDDVAVFVRRTPRQHVDRWGDNNSNSLVSMHATNRMVGRPRSASDVLPMPRRKMERMESAVTNTVTTTPPAPPTRPVRRPSLGSSSSSSPPLPVPSTATDNEEKTEASLSTHKVESGKANKMTVNAMAA